jgi:hypothetical protein
MGVGVAAHGEVEPAPRAGAVFDRPFRPEALAWSVVEIADAGDAVRVAPYLHGWALRERLDADVGVSGWSLRYQLAPGEAVACQLSIAGVSKGAVRNLPRVGGAEVGAGLAFSAAAELFGARLPVASDLSAWVACDPETHAPLHPPELGSLPRKEDSPLPTEVVSPVAAAAEGATASETGAVKADAQTMIDRLIDRLKEQGQGLAAARILVKHGGYGKDPQAARELYAALRALWLSGREATEGAQSE